MNITILIIIALLCFGATTVFRHISDSKTLISVAIGCAINSNIYNSVSMPIKFAGMVFGIDSVLYTLFMFTVIVKAKDYSIAEAKDMTISTIIAILVSALIEFSAVWSFSGIDRSELNRTASYLLSALGTFAGIWTMLWCFRIFEEKKINIYLTFAVGVIIASLINSSIYFCGIAVVQGDFSSILSPALTGSYVGKLASTVLGLICYYINTKYLHPVPFFVRRGSK